MRLNTWFAAIAAAGSLHAETVVFLSGPKQVHLLELYTSEGCSSCPPAEAWLGSLRGQAGLWKDYVPVAFHVDYWNTLGWPDRYSSPDFTQRQRDYANVWRADSVYTPEFVLDGAEWRRTGRAPSASAESPGELSLKVEDGKRVAISFHPSSSTPESLYANLTPLGFGIVTDVRAGENGGRKLPHEFIALAVLRTPMRRSADGTFAAEITLPDKTEAPIQGLAAWVSSGESLKPIQAVGGMLTGP